MSRVDESTANVYIDGLNLYYRLLRGKPNRRWLDLRALAEALLPDHRIATIRYFTARVRDFDATGAHQRQETYLQALATIAGLKVHFGSFRLDTRRRKLATPMPDGTEFVDVLIPEEKGSDVNLAAHLLVDGAAGRFDTALVITNDTDLSEPIRLATSELGRRVVLAHPSPAVAGSLRRAGPSAVMRIHVSTVLKCQLPDPVITRKGRRIHKPPSW